MAKHTLAIDLETFSDNDIRYGVHKYVDTPNFEILLFAYAMDGGPVQQVEMAQGEEIPPEVMAWLQDPEILKTAFNANFELCCLQHVFGADAVPDWQWECDSVLGLYNSYPAGLGITAKVLGLGADKQKDTRGKALIKYFCQPCKPTAKNGQRTRNKPYGDPDKWEIFKEYNRQDVVTEMAIREALVHNRPGKKEHELWLCDRWINNNGIQIDQTLVKNAISFSAQHSAALMDRAIKLTGLDNPNSVLQLKSWLAGELGEAPVSLDKETVQELLKTPGLPARVRELLLIRQGLGKTSIKKYEAMEASVCTDGRAHDLFQFYGAQRSGRWSGRNIQLQNLPRNSMEDLNSARELVKDGDLETTELLYDVPDALKQLVRTALVAPTGSRFIVADFSAIEARVIAWLAGETWEMEAFAQGKDVYCATASAMFGVPVVKHGVNGELRQKGKIATLACGYGGGVGALKAMGADKMGLTDGELQHIVDKWRKASPHIVQLWHDLEDAALQCVGTQRDVHLPKYHDLRLLWQNGNMLLQLPSGRMLTYLHPSIKPNRFDRMAVTYEGLKQTTNLWCRLETYGGKLVENVVQAIARDCLAAAMLRIYEGYQKGENHYKICAHIHDEMVIETPEGEGSLEDVVRIVCINEPWNQGLIMNADGFEAAYYKKD